jgi:hypothetical protein
MTEEKDIPCRWLGANDVFCSRSVAAIVTAETDSRHREKLPIYRDAEATGQ